MPSVLEKQELLDLPLNTGDQEKFDEIDLKDPNKLYFVRDTKQIYKGDELYTDAIRIEFERPQTPAVGKLYYILINDSYEYYLDGMWRTLLKKVSYIDLSPPIVEEEDGDGSNANSQIALIERLSSQVPNCWALVSFVSQQINEALTWTSFIEDEVVEPENPDPPPTIDPETPSTGDEDNTEQGEDEV